MRMLVASNIRYSELFAEVMPENVETLLEGIPTDKIVIPHLCYINGLLYAQGRDIDQVKMLNALLPVANVEVKKILTDRLLLNSTRYGANLITPMIFSQNTTFRFLTHELNNTRIIKSELLPSDWDLRLLKAYLWFDQQMAKDISHVMTKFIPEEYKDLAFQWSSWPVLIRQYDFLNRTDDSYKFVKIVLTFKYLMSSEFSSYVDSYIVKKGFTSFDHLIHNYLDFQTFLNKENKQMPYIKANHYEPIIDLLTLDKEKFRSDVKNQKDVIHIREKPLYKIDSETYCVMSSGFIDNLFDFTYLFDFYNISGINAIYREFKDFKKMIGEEVMEKIYFRKIIKHYFRGKHIKIEFDEKPKVGFPDAYVRDGNDIYLFEFKDYLMSSDVSNSYEFEDIKNNIDLKYIKNQGKKSKGISQIINNLKRLDSGYFGEDVYPDNKDFLKKVKVFPVLVYTHSLYATPGINSYLSKKFDEKLLEEFPNGTLFKVLPVVMISLSCLVGNQLYFTKGSMSLKKTIIDYTDKIANRKRKLIKKSDLELNRSDLVNNQFSAHVALEDEYKHIFENWFKKKVTFKTSMDFFEYMSKIDQ